MAHADALTLGRDHGGHGVARWAAAIAVVLALHAGALLYLQQAPEPAGFEGQTPIELDLLPPPAGEAQLDVAGQNAAAMQADAVPTETPEDVKPDDAPPPPEAETPPDEVEPADQPPVAATEAPPDVAAAPPDVEPAVPLPPEDAVVAQDEPVEPPKKEPPVIKRETPRRTPPKVEPKRETAERERPVSRPAQASTAGGRGGASAVTGAARSAAASGYKNQIRAQIAAQQRRTTGISGRATVTFSVNRGGAVISVSASGPPDAAREAVAMVRRASFPPMPADMAGSSSLYTLPIGFTAGR